MKSQTAEIERLIAERDDLRAEVERLRDLNEADNKAWRDNAIDSARRIDELLAKVKRLEKAEAERDELRADVERLEKENKRLGSWDTPKSDIVADIEKFLEDNSRENDKPKPWVFAPSEKELLDQYLLAERDELRAEVERLRDIVNSWAEDSHAEWCCGEGLCCCGHQDAREYAKQIAATKGCGDE